MNPKVSRRWLLVVFPGILVLALIVIVFLVRSPQNQPKPPRKAAPSVESFEVREERAREVGEFQKRHIERINAKFDDRIKADTKFAGSLESLDKEDIESLEGFTPAEKKEMWELVEAAKARAKKMKKGTGGQEGKKE